MLLWFLSGTAARHVCNHCPHGRAQNVSGVDTVGQGTAPAAGWRTVIAGAALPAELASKQW
jgi:hypothetical protein